MPLRLDNNSRVALCSFVAVFVCGVIVWNGAHFLEGRHQEFEHEAALENIAERREVADEGDWLEATSDPEAAIEHTPWEGTVSVRVDEAMLYQSVAVFEEVTGLSLENSDMCHQADSFGFDVVVVTVDLTVRNDGAHTNDAEKGAANIRSNNFPIAVDNTPCSMSFCGAIIEDELNLNYSTILREGDTQSMTLVFALPGEGSESVLGAMAQVFPPYKTSSTLHILIGNLVDNLEGSVVDEYPFLLELHPQEATG